MHNTMMEPLIVKIVITNVPNVLIMIHVHYVMESENWPLIVNVQLIIMKTQLTWHVRNVVTDAYNVKTVPMNVLSVMEPEHQHQIVDVLTDIMMMVSILLANHAHINAQIVMSMDVKVVKMTPDITQLMDAHVTQI